MMAASEAFINLPALGQFYIQMMIVASMQK